MRLFIKCAAHITLYFVIVGFWKSSPQIHPTTPHLMRITITNPVWLTTIILSLELNIPHYRVRMWGFIKRCWKCVINFGLQWSLQNIAKLKSYIKHVLSVHCNKRGAENVKARKNTKVFWLILSTKIENIWKQYLTKNLNHRHFVHLHISSSFTSPHNGIPRPQKVSPPISSSEATAVFVLRIDGRLRLQEPLDHGIVAVAGCPVQRCSASGAAARGQATGRTQRNEGEKISEKNWAPQKAKFWKLWPLRNPPWTKGTLCFWGCFQDGLITSSWLKKLLPVGLNKISPN